MRTSTSLLRALTLLDALASDEALEGDGLGVTRLAVLIGEDKGQVSRSLTALAGSGFVERDPATRRYRLGWHLFTLAARTGHHRISMAARPALSALTAATQESSHLSILQGTDVVTLVTESPSRALSARHRVGGSAPAYCTSAGRALLGTLPPAEVRDLFAGVTFRRFAPATPRDVGELLERMVEDRRRGYVLADEEFEAGLVSVAAPVCDDGGVVAALNVSAPTFRMSDRSEVAGRAVRAAADAVSRQLQRRPTALTTLI